MLKLDGRRDPERRAAVERGDWGIVLASREAKKVIGEDGETFFEPKAYLKNSVTYAVQIPVKFQVDTLEGMHSADAGDYLAIGAAGEMYPIRKDIFESTYDPA